MADLWIISTSLDNINAEGNFFWRHQYLEAIKPYLRIECAETKTYAEAIIYFNKAQQKQKKALRAVITFVSYNSYYLKLQYKITGESEFFSYQVKEALKSFLKVNSIYQLPFCILADEAEFRNLLNSQSFITELEFFCAKNQWEKAYALAYKYKPWQNSIVWNTPEYLRTISFITAKISEATVNAKKLFPDKKDRIKYFEEKKNYREETKFLRDRLIEIEPANAANYSAMAYTFYLSVMELLTAGGRRDGDVIKEADWAVYYFDKALELDPTRISDSYRKGQLLLRILPKYILYTDSEDDMEQRYQQAREYMNIGVETLEKAVQVYENKIENDFWKKHWRKYYVKTLYNLAYGKLQLGRANLKIVNNEIICVDKEDETKSVLLEQGLKYIGKCIEADAIKSGEISDITEQNNNLCGVYKAYLKGVIHLHLYMRLRQSIHKETAWEYLHKANEIRFPLNMQRQNRIFVLEKTALYYIIEKKYKNAIILLEQSYLRSNKFPEYAAYTLALAYLLIGDKQKAKEIAEKILRNNKCMMRKKLERLIEYIKGGSEKLDWTDELPMEIEEDKKEILEPK